MKCTKVLCLSEQNDNILMWSHYAQSHTGAVFKLRCLPERDSGWGSAMRVRYSDRIPTFVDNEVLIELLSGHSKLSPKDIIDTFVTTKSKHWEYEKEWRIALHFTDPEINTLDIPFWPDELSAVYLGCRIAPEQKKKIVENIRSGYPHVTLFEAVPMKGQFSLEFREQPF